MFGPTRTPIDFGGAWNPGQLGSNLLARFLDGQRYNSNALDGLQILQPQEPFGTLRAPRQGRCYDFDGADDHIAFPPRGCPASFSFLAKIKPDTFTGRLIWIGQALIGFINSSTIVFWHNVGAASTNISLSQSVSSVAWQDFCVTHTGSTTRVFIDGVQVGSATTGVIATASGSFQVGRYLSGAGYDGKWAGLYLFDTVLTDQQISDFTAAGSVPSSGILILPMAEETGTVSYDISSNANHGTLTNITQATFHAADSGVTKNPNNYHGYRISSGVYIPRRLGTDLAADGNALTHTGRTPYPATVETPCVTGDGSAVYVNLDSVITPNLTNPWKVQATFKLNSTASTQTIVFIGDGTRSITIQYRVSVGFQCAFLNGTFFGPSTASLTSALDGNWHTITMEHFGSNSVQVTLDGVVIPNGSPNADTGALLSARLLHRATGSSLANISDFRFTDNGVTKYFPLQDGPGSSNTNRNVAWVASDGTSGMIANAIVGGTVANIWANRCPGFVRDHCIEYGGRIGAAGEFIPGKLDGSGAADGNALTLLPGKHGNPYSRLNANPFSAAEYNGRSVPTALAPAEALTVAPANTGWNRISDDGSDRYIVLESPGDTQNLINYTSQNLVTLDDGDYITTDSGDLIVIG